METNNTHGAETRTPAPKLKADRAGHDQIAGREPLVVSEAQMVEAVARSYARKYAKQSQDDVDTH